MWRVVDAMNASAEAKVRAGFCPARRVFARGDSIFNRAPGLRRYRMLVPVPQRNKRKRRGLLILALATGYLLFCHGCHADDDTELFLAAQQKSPRSLACGPFAADHFGRGTSNANG